MTFNPDLPHPLHALHPFSRPSPLQGAPEERFERLTRIAARLIEVPVAILAAIEDGEVVVKSAHGTTHSEAWDRCFRQQSAPIRQILLKEEPLTVPDASIDPRFAQNRLPPFVRFYAGRPLHGTGPREGIRLGILALFDSRSRLLDAGKSSLLADLAAIAAEELDFDRVLHDLRAPLGQISGELDRLLATGLTPEQERHAVEIGSGSAAMLALLGGGELPPSPSDEPSPSAPPPPSLRVLVAGDNRVNQMIALEQLARLGCHAEAVSGGREALAILDGGSFDAALLDCQMPGLDASRIASAVREREQRQRPAAPLRIVAVTAQAAPEEREACLRAGIDGYIAKPLRLEELRHALFPANAPAVPAAPVVSLEQLETLRGESPGLLERLVLLFGETAQKAIAGMESAAEAGDAKAVAAGAHMLKGSASNFGAHRLVAACEAIEEAADLGETAAFAPRLAAIRAEFRAVAEALENVR